MNVVPELREELRDAAVRMLVGEPSIASASPRSRRRWRGWLGRGGLPLVMMLVVATGGIATGAGFVISEATKARSESLTTSPGPTAERPGRFARLGEEMVAQAQEIEATLPYPPGLQDDYDWSKYSAGATLGTGGETRREMALMIETRAQCLWQVAYLRARDASDQAGADAATVILQQSARWPATRSLSGGTTLAGVALGFIDRGDTTGLRRNVRINCSEFVRNPINPRRDP